MKNSTLVIGSKFFILFALLLGALSWGLSLLISLPLAGLFFLVSLLLAFKLFVFISLFPGYTWAWRRSIEASYCRQISEQMLLKVKDLKSFLEGLLTNSYQQFPSMRSEMLTIINNLTDLSREQSLSYYQRRMLKTIQSLVLALEECKLSVNSSDQISLWDWIDASSSRSGLDSVDILHQEHIQKSLQICSDLESQLQSASGAVCFPKRMWRWLFNDSLGSMSYMRIDLTKRFCCEQIWVISNDGSQIDCLWVPSQYPDNACIVICTDEYYEYFYYNTEWIEFYHRVGISVMLWNFRGFGRTKGFPQVGKLVNDAKSIVDHIRMKKNIMKIGVHGEEIGALIAIQVANTHNVDFLFADGAFWSLGFATYFNSSKLLYWIIKLTQSDTISLAEQFLQVSCYKVLSSSEGDLGSLKTGVAFGLLGSILGINEKNACKRGTIKQIGYILSNTEFKDFHNSLKRMKGIFAGIGEASLRKKMFSRYRLIETNCADEELQALVQRISEVFDGIESGGKPIKDVKDRFGLLMWVSILDIWGVLSELPQDHLPNTVNKLKETCEQLEKIVNDCTETDKDIIKKICEDVTVIAGALDKVKKHLETRNEAPDISADSFMSFFTDKGHVIGANMDYTKAGRLLAIRGEGMAQIEKYQFEKHLTNVSFVN